MTSNTPKRRRVALAMTAVIFGAAIVFSGPVLRGAKSRLGKHTVASRQAQLEDRMRPLWETRCKVAGLSYPPAKIVLVVLKEEKLLHVFAAEAISPQLIATYPILAASGATGPKLREGDRQVPEGIYRAESLNPNSLYHLAIRVNYPSDDDRAVAASESRTNLGGDIMIHGGSASIGCVAIGDAAIEEVFYVAAGVGVDNVEILVAPGKQAGEYVTPETPQWVAQRYQRLNARMDELQWR